MEKQRKNWMNRYSTLTGMLIVLAVILIQIIQPSFSNSNQHINISKTIQNSDKCPLDVSSFEGDNVDYKQLNSNPRLYTRRLAKFTGYVNQVQELNGKGIIFLQLQKEKPSNPDELVYINYSGHIDIVENEMITVYGFVTGTAGYIPETNVQITIPKIMSCKIVAVK
jgi:hypothetical protein